MSDKKYIYWGGPNFGKEDIQITCQINGVNSAMICKDYIFVRYNTRNNDIIETKHQLIYVKKNGELICSEEVITKKNINTIKFIPREIQPQITTNFQSLKDKKKYNSTEKMHKNIWETLPYVAKLVKDVPVLVVNMDIFKHENIIKELLELKNTIHIIPYRKQVTVNFLLSKINMYENSYNSNNLNYFDLYEQNKFEAFNWLDNFIIQQRKIERLLIDKKIKITYFDLDEYNYSIFDFKNYFKKNFSEPIYNIEIPEIKKKYDKACLIADEYIKIRNLTDTRLSYQFIDNILI